MKIIIDAMGGDNAPAEIVKGAALATQKYKSRLILVGNKPVIEKHLADCGVFSGHGIGRNPF